MNVANSLRISTFNIRYDSMGGGFPALPALNLNETINTTSFKVLVNQVQDLTVLLGEDWDWVGVGRDDGKDKESMNIWLSETPDVPGSVGWDAILPRIVTQARFQDLLTNSIFWWFNTHFDNEGRIAREESAKLIMKNSHDLLESDSETLILTGDFNCEEKDKPYQLLTGEKYIDKSLKKEELFSDSRYEIMRPHAISFGHSNTFTGFSPDVKPIRIDFILINDNALLKKKFVKVLNHGVMPNLYDDGLYISDHRPVIADLLFQ
ncbi:11129_t:CDS:2 [Diversispora eburnea]|uniref:11129_t:CDS:1 n=1 Tax=Diversispora eburnea TaxID=1213867 RepID=A0A9N9F6J2_9GLOM|nr:11129_t:CDS:2 [Diversispora eburnea]